MQPTDTSRGLIIRQLAELIGAVKRPHPVRVAIDGRSAAGKSTLGEELAALLGRHRSTIQTTIDDFYRRWVHRHNRSALTAEAFYADAYDYTALRTLLLDPLGPGGSRRYRARWHDGWHEGGIDEPERVAPDDAVLILDGVFLLRPELVGEWDVCIYVDIDAAQSLDRGVMRDLALDAPADLATRREQRARVYRERYVPADDRYLRAVNPIARADIVVDNRALESPRLIVRRRPI